MIMWIDDSNARLLAFNALEGELNYQVEKWSEHRHSNAEFAVFIEEYLNDLKELVTKSDSNDPEVKRKEADIMRKVTALGVAAMIENGIAKRGM